jgi:hypothetical protein
MTLKLNGSSSGYTAIDAPAAAGSNTLVLPTNNGSANQILQTDGNGNLSWVDKPVPGGITEADIWRLTSNLTGNQLPITSSDIERADDASYSKVGTGMSVSSGVFSFPSTGIWRVTWYAAVECSASTHQNVFTTEVTTNNGGAWDTTMRQRQGVYKMSSGNSFGSATSTCFVDVTDTSNVKVRFEYIAGQGSEILIGDTAGNQTSWEFIRLADT